MSQFEWHPEEGAVLTRQDLEHVFLALRALINGTDKLEANRAHAVDIAAFSESEIPAEIIRPRSGQPVRV